MRKYFLVLFIFCLSGVALAQDIGFGVKGGLNLSSLSFEETYNLSSSGRTAFHVGFIAEIPLTQKISIQPELLYSTEGGTYLMERSTSVPIVLEEKIDYLNLPVMAKYYLVDGFAVEAGPQFGYLVSGKTYEMLLGGGERKINTKDSHRSFDFGLGAGLSYEFSNGIFLAARYTFGLTKIYDQFEFMHYKEWDVKKTNFQLSVGYFL